MQRYKWNNGSGIYKHFRDTIWDLITTIKWLFNSRSSIVLFFFLIFFSGAFLATRLLDTTTSITSIDGSAPSKTIIKQNVTSNPKPSVNSETTPKPPVNSETTPKPPVNSETTPKPPVNSETPPKLLVIPVSPPEPIARTQNIRKKIEYPLNCSSGTETRTCPVNYYPSTYSQNDPDSPLPATCPEYFRWIHEDLRPWRDTGITKEMVMSARRTANFRLVISGGRAYVETYRKAFQSRDTFTLWGILQLLRKYPGRIPDLDLMFDCVDWPVVLSKLYRGPNATAPPPVFRFCKDDATLDIPFPDWSFWGWPEINIKPWGRLLEELKEGNKKVTWTDREPYAYWKGNPAVAETRMDLLKCNVSDKQDWGARVYAQDWLKESQQGFKQSDLANQCLHRYKIYIEGSAWSVSEKYILACNSLTLVVNPRYYDFFSRSLMPVEHYWPVKENDKCKSIKFAVDWGNRHKKKAQVMGNLASNFIQEDLKMDYVYDYMFHLLNEYAKLFKYKPTIPPKAIELCSEAMACSAQGFSKQFMMDSLVMGPADEGPCTMPPSQDPAALYALKKRKERSIKNVESWENKFWQNQTIQT